MFPTSVLECRKTLDPAMAVRGVSENRPVSQRPSWPVARPGPGLYVSDKENRPEVTVKLTKGAWWLQQRQTDALQQQMAQERLRGEPVRARRSEGSRQAEPGAEKVQQLEAKLQRQAAEFAEERRRSDAALRAEKDRAERLARLLRGSEASAHLAGLHEMRGQLQELSHQADLHEEQLAALSNRRLASRVVQSAVLRALRNGPEASQESEASPLRMGQDAAVQASLAPEADEELRCLRSELAEAQAAAEVRKVCSREVCEELQKDCDRWQRHAEGLEKQVELSRSQGCDTCAPLLAESQELALTVTALKEQCASLEVEKKSLTSKVASLQESLEDVSSSHAELAGHANHRQKIRHTVQLKEDRDNYREENFRLKQRILQLEAGNSSQGIVRAVTGHAGAEPRSRTSRLSSRAHRSSTESLDASQRSSAHHGFEQQQQRELERIKINVTHFMALIERAVSTEGEKSTEGETKSAKSMAVLLQTLRQRFIS